MPELGRKDVLARVPENDRVAFTKALAHIAAADDEVTIDEREAVMHFADTWQLSESEKSQVQSVLQQDAGTSLDDLMREFSEASTSFLLMQEIVRLSHADGDYAEVERNEVLSIAESMEIPRERVAEIEAWVERGLVWGFPDDDAPTQDDVARRLETMDERYGIGNSTVELKDLDRHFEDRNK
jgi:uncharacterized tellurite resistance protein B-like protein